MKKNLLPEGNPVLNILGYDAPVQTQAPVQPQIKKREESKPEVTYTEGRRRGETKSKRLNLLVKPSSWEALTKIAENQDISVNELINRLIDACINKS